MTQDSVNTSGVANTPITGRPTKYTDDLASSICEGLASGLSLLAICDGPDMPGVTTVYRWLEEKVSFRDMYSHARRLQADSKFDEADEIAKNATAENVHVARLQIDTIKWQTARLAPRKYGDKVALVGGDPENGDKPVQMDVSNLTDEQLRALASIPVR